MSQINEPWEYGATKAQILPLFDHSVQQIIRQMPVPGVVILVHGVNSDGEWYDQVEEGLCKGLNARLARQNEQLCFTGVKAGQMFPTKYLPELTADGFVDRKRSVNNFISRVSHFSPVVRFRWGYKANHDDLAELGKNIYLNEQHYWGGGPFANGCTALPDCWAKGFNDRLFLWLTAQHLNPTTTREVFRCPHRTYFVHAAWRLAKLIELIRSKHGSVPITVVCHSQGNMVGMAAAFLGDVWDEVADRCGNMNKAVADTYVLCNPPYSLRAGKMGADNWTQREEANTKGERGRQSGAARAATLKNFLNILRERAEGEQPATILDEWASNLNPRDGSLGYSVLDDRKRYGLPGVETTKGRVTLYCNPADQVISAETIQGIGWMGVSDAERTAINAAGVFTQRVWAQGFEVGTQGRYHFWENHWAKPAPGDPAFWSPESPEARFSLSNGLAANESPLGKLATFIAAPITAGLLALAKPRINALPPKDWSITVDAPPLLKPFAPKAMTFSGEGAAKEFDQQKDAPAALRNEKKANRDPNDPYDRFAGGKNDTPQGTETTEAQLRYEDRARIRMHARRDGRADAQGTVKEEDQGAEVSAEYAQWRYKKISEFLLKGSGENATDHSTILTNPANAEKALAYDVAVGYTLLSPADWREIRAAADWRLVGEIDGGKHPLAKFGEYIESGTLDGKHLASHPDYSPSAMPPKIVDEREMKPSRTEEER